MIIIEVPFSFQRAEHMTTKSWEMIHAVCVYIHIT